MLPVVFRERYPAFNSGDKIAGRFRPPGKPDHVVKHPIEKAGVGRDGGGKTECRRAEAIGSRITHFDRRNEDFQRVAIGEHIWVLAILARPRAVPLQRVAEIDGQGDTARMFRAESRHERRVTNKSRGQE